MENNSQATYGAVDTRYEEIRALREQRRAAREGQQAKAAARKAEKKARAPLNTHAAVARYREDEEFGEPEEAELYGVRPKGSFGRVLLVQTAVCALLVGGIFLAQKAMPNTYRQIHTAYTQVMKTDMTAKEVWAAAVAVFRSLKDDLYVIAPVKDQPTAQAPTQAPTEPATEPAPRSGEVGAIDEEDIIEEEFDGVGGFDLAVEYAAKQCAAAPLRTTAWPVRPVAAGRLTSCFGYRVHPITKKEGVHTGMDIGAPEGDPIYAAFYGTVREAGKSKGYGNYIILDHAGGLQTVYAHCSEILAEKGMVLRAGDVIAKVGSTGNSTGPHLHFEVRLNGMRCDPVPLFPGDMAYPVKGEPSAE